jgi:hypothetical protein
VPAPEWLDPSVVRYLVEQFGGTREAAVATWQLPAFRKLLEDHGARLETDADGRPYVAFPYRDIDQACWKIVEAAVGPGAGFFGSADGEANEPAPLVSERHPYPKPLPTLYVRTTIQAELRRLEGKPTRAKRLPEKDAIRAEKMWGKRLLRLDENDHLVADDRVLQTRGLKIGLRFWDEERGHWLDPYSAL